MSFWGVTVSDGNSWFMKLLDAPPNDLWNFWVQEKTYHYDLPKGATWKHSKKFHPTKSMSTKKILSFYSFSNNNGSGDWLYLNGNYHWRDPLFTWQEGKWNTVCFPGDRDLEMLVHLHTGSIGLWPRMPKSYLADFADDDGKMLLGKDDGDGDGGGGGGCCHSLLGPNLVVSKFFLDCFA